MSKGYFIDNISDETLAKLIDETLKHERNKKTERGKFKMNNAIFKIIPAVAVVILAIVLVNNLNIFSKMIDTEGNETNPGVAIVEQDVALSNTELTEIPRIVEKSLFEHFMINIPKNTAGTRVVAKMNAYYELKDIDGVEFYVFDQDASDREIKEMLSLWNEYVDWSDSGYHQMLIAYKMVDNELAYDPYAKYAHVRFGNTKDILLLDVEWHTYETYLQRMEDYKKSEYSNEEQIKMMEEDLELIKEGKYYQTRLINGKDGKDGKYGETWIGRRYDNGTVNISQFLDKDGYYIFYIYPYRPYVAYYDENNEFQVKFFDAYTKREYESALKNEVIPFCDELLANGQIRQEEYDRATTLDPLDYYVDLYFN